MGPKMNALSVMTAKISIVRSPVPEPDFFGVGVIQGGKLKVQGTQIRLQPHRGQRLIGRYSGSRNGG